MIKESPLTGDHMVVFKKVSKNPTTAQRKLWWLWCGEVSMSGLGQDDDKNEVHIRAKLMFVHPILMRDDEVYPVFANQYISTERLTKHQRAESLKEFQLYWTGKGVNLTDPNLYGLDETLFKKNS